MDKEKFLEIIESHYISKLKMANEAEKKFFEYLKCFQLLKTSKDIESQNKYFKICCEKYNIVNIIFKNIQSFSKEFIEKIELEIGDNDSFRNEAVYKKWKKRMDVLITSDVTKSENISECNARLLKIYEKFKKANKI